MRPSEQKAPARQWPGRQVQRSGRCPAAIVALLLAFLALAPDAARADVEPNDGITQAEGPIMAGTTYEGTLANKQDKDTYLFYVSGQQQLSIQVRETNGTEHQSDCLYVYFGDSDNQSIDHKSFESDAEFRYTTPPGVNRFYLSLESSYECEGGTAYSVLIEPAGALVDGPKNLPPVPTDEPNEDEGQALGPLLADTAYTGEIQTENDEDWFKFYTAPGTHQVDVAVAPLSYLCSESEGAGSVQGPGVDLGLAFGRNDGQSVWNHVDFTSSSPGVYYVHFGTGEVFGGYSHCLGAAYEFVIQPPEAIATKPPGAWKQRRGYAVAARIGRVNHRRARVRLWCKGAGNCRGWLKLTARVSGRQVKVGRTHFSFGQGRSLVLKMRISRKARQLLDESRAGRLPLKLTGKGVRGRTVVLVAKRDAGRKSSSHLRSRSAITGGRWREAPVASAQARRATVPTVMSCGTGPLYSSDGEQITKGTIHYVSHPRYCNFSYDGSEAGRVNLERLHWRHWGARRAVASGLLKDNHDQDENGFQRHPVQVVVYQRFLAFSGVRHYYSLMHIRGVPGKLGLYLPPKMGICIEFSCPS